MKKEVPQFLLKRQCSSHGPPLMEVKTLTCRILHGHTPEVLARKLQTHIFPKNEELFTFSTLKYSFVMTKSYSIEII